MGENLIQAMEQELAALEAKASAVRSVLDLYRDGQSQGSDMPKAQHQPNAQQRVVDTVKIPASGSVMESINRIAHHVVTEAGGRPVPSTEILKAVEAQGVRIEGITPRNSVSSALSRNPGFQANGRAGWTLKNSNRGANAPNENGEAKASPDAGGVAAPSTDSVNGLPDLLR